MTTINDILITLEKFAPMSLAESWDNCGLLVGERHSPVYKCLIALDITLDVLNEAISTKCELIISHHPLIFTSTNSVTTDNTTGEIIMTAIKNDISIICMHTNLDSCDGGVNDALANALGLLDIKNLGAGESLSLGRFGILPERIDLTDFLPIVKSSLNANSLRYTGCRKVFRVGVLGGAGGKMIDLACANRCDTYVTSEVSYDTYQKALDLGINIIDAGHFATENVICDVLAKLISKQCEPIISTTHKDIVDIF